MSKHYTVKMIEARDQLLHRALRALEEAHTLIIDHHNLSKMKEFTLGTQCPACVDRTGKSEELDRIVKTKKEIKFMLTYSGTPIENPE